MCHILKPGMEKPNFKTALSILVIPILFNTSYDILQNTLWKRWLIYQAET